DDRRRVEVEVGAGRGARVPAEPDYDRGKAGRLLGQRDVAALGETDTHCCSLLRTKTVRMCSVTLSCRRLRASATLYGHASAKEGRSLLGRKVVIQQSRGLYPGVMQRNVVLPGRPDARTPGRSQDRPAGSSRDARVDPGVDPR